MLLDEYNVEEKIELNEGEETDDFWTLLGGKDDYRQIKDMMLADSSFEPILFEISN